MLHKNVLQQLLPLELAGVSDEDFALEGAVLDAANASADALLSEMFPRTCAFSLVDWELRYGLPDTCTGILPTVQQRRMAVVSKDEARPNLRRQYYLDLAASLGIAITITEGINGDPYTWQVNASAETIYESTVESPCTDPLRTWGNDLLECIIKRDKPAHTHVLFAYGGE